MTLEIPEPVDKTVEHAEALGVDPDELRAFYRGRGPKPVPVEDLPHVQGMAEAIEAIGKRQAARHEIEYLGGGWYRLANGDKVQGLESIEQAISEEE